MNAVGGLKIDNPVFQSKKREIAALADKFAGCEHIALLTNKDAASRHQLTAKTLDAAPLRIGIAAVLGTSAAFFCRHRELTLVNRFDLNF